jgi:hypothetical protein
MDMNWLRREFEMLSANDVRFDDPFKIYFDPNQPDAHEAQPEVLSWGPMGWW